MQQSSEEQGDKQENKDKLGRSVLPSNHHHSNHRKDSRQPVSYSKGIPSPTLAELNTIAEGPRTKRANTTATSTYISPYSPSPPPISSAHLFSNSVSDSCSSVLHPRMAFNEREGYDELSSSFRSLYKSLFGQSVPHGDYFSNGMAGNRNHIAPNLLGSSPGNDLNLSNSCGSLSLGASAGNLLNSVNNPQFTSLMGSFKDIAETNSWDKLDPAQIQGLVDSFKAGEHDKFGLDQDSYADLYASFNQFLSQLNNKFLTGSSNLSPQLSEYSQHSQPPPPPVPSRGTLHGQILLGGTIEGNLAHTHKYHLHHTLDTVAPSPLLSMHHHGTSPPTNFHPNSNRTPSPNTGCSPHQPHPHQYRGYISTGNATTFNSAAIPSGASDGLNLRSAATDLFDDDDFDWSKLM